MKVKIETVWANQIDETHWVTEARDKSGRIYIHQHQFDSLGRLAEKMFPRIWATMEINLEHWGVYIPYGTDAWLIDGMEVTLMDEEERHFKRM